MADASYLARITMATLDSFRSTVGAAALGFARRAMDARPRWRNCVQRPVRASECTQPCMRFLAFSISDRVK